MTASTAADARPRQSGRGAHGRRRLRRTHDRNAAILLDVTQSHRLTPGDILVTRQTDPGWGPIFPLISGLVIERGGMLSHGAIIAREFGIPSVVGVKDATRRIQHGGSITVDGDRGLVLVTAEPRNDRRLPARTVPAAVLRSVGADSCAVCGRRFRWLARPRCERGHRPFTSRPVPHLGRSRRPARRFDNAPHRVLVTRTRPQSLSLVFGMALLAVNVAIAVQRDAPLVPLVSLAILHAALGCYYLSRDGRTVLGDHCCCRSIRRSF